MSSPINIKLDYCPHPRETIIESLNVMGISPFEFSIAANMPLNDVSDLLSGISSINEDIAAKLEKVIGTPSQFWLNLEQNYQNFIKDVAQ